MQFYLLLGGILFLSQQQYSSELLELEFYANLTWISWSGYFEHRINAVFDDSLIYLDHK